ncbi:MAG: molecular chaperone HtpG, partial [Clostridiaceae bacterium]|nr:molecular chaperone HtpG [Clostridiaceae bacterium]
MTRREGSISVSTENIFPIIRKWLYSDQDIFIRELVANASDAIHKLERLDIMGEADVPEDTTYKIDIVLDTDANTLEISDNGLGMTLEEIDKYIND